MPRDMHFADPLNACERTARHHPTFEPMGASSPPAWRDDALRADDSALRRWRQAHTDTDGAHARRTPRRKGRRRRRRRWETRGADRVLERLEETEFITLRVRVRHATPGHARRAQQQLVSSLGAALRARWISNFEL
jgi:hypothetical protein